MIKKTAVKIRRYPTEQEKFLHTIYPTKDLKNSFNSITATITTTTKFN